MFKQKKYKSLSFVFLISLAVVFCWQSALWADAVRKLIAEEGKGYLETVDGYLVLHLKGTPQEMGHQHGVLLKDRIKQNINFLLQEDAENGVEVGSVKIPRAMIGGVLIGAFEGKVPARFNAEMKAIAKAAEIPEWKVVAANLIPEMFHCSGFALLSKATADGKLYHGRVLDYGIELKLQDHAVVIIQEPEGRNGFVNVSYAGFIGSVTGMNTEQISIGEMGGKGVGQWDGIPMSFLVRMVLEDAGTLDEAIRVFSENKRTCEYFYVIADAKSDSAVGIKAVPERIEIVRPGAKHALLPTPVENTVLMSSGNRYKELARLVKDGHGKFDENSAIRLMDKPVAMKSNLHNALMIPADGVVWVANADTHGKPAWKQKYYRFDIMELMKSRPENKAERTQ